jgi:hypothetical protein
MDRDVVLTSADQFRLAWEAYESAVEARKRADEGLQDAALTEARAQRALQDARHALLNAACGREGAA